MSTTREETLARRMARDVVARGLTAEEIARAAAVARQRVPTGAGKAALLEAWAEALNEEGTR